MIITRPEVRKYIYSIIAAAMPILAFFGIVGPEDAHLWLLLAAAVLGLGSGLLAIPNTTPSPNGKTGAVVVNVNEAARIEAASADLDALKRRQEIFKNIP